MQLYATFSISLQCSGVANFKLTPQVWHSSLNSVGVNCVPASAETISKSIFFLDGNFFVFHISFISPQNACFLCTLCGKVTELFSFAPNYNVQNLFWNKQVCPEFINVIIENNLLHRSGAKSTL